MQITPYVILYLLPAGIATAIAGYNWRRPGRDHVMLVSLLMASVGFWCVCHALSIAGMQYETVLFWSQVQYFGIVLVPPLFALFALAYTGHIGRVGSVPRIALFIPAALSLAAVLSNNIHHLWWAQITLNTSRPFYSLDLVRG